MSQEETEQISTLPTEDSALNPCVLVLSGDSTGRLYRLESTTTIVGRAEDADIVLTDRGISRQHTKFTLTPDRQVILSDLDSTNGTFLGTDKIRSCQLFGGERLRFGATVKMKFDYRDPSEEQLIEGVARDPLTGALNRSYFEQRFKEACAKAKRHKSPLSCAFIDADHFKHINDTHGHHTGDEVLVALGRRSRGAAHALPPALRVPREGSDGLGLPWRIDGGRLRENLTLKLKAVVGTGLLLWLYQLSGRWAMGIEMKLYWLAARGFPMTVAMHRSLQARTREACVLGGPCSTPATHPPPQVLLAHLLWVVCGSTVLAVIFTKGAR